MTLRLLTSSALMVLGLAGCYTWDASDRPISGIKITSPAGAVDVPGNVYTFSGSIVANQPRRLVFGIRYRPHGYEAYIFLTYAGFVQDIDTTLDDQSTTYARNIQLPTTALPGQYLFYSYIQDARGKTSDTNRTFRDVAAPSFYPTVTPTAEAKSEVAQPRNRGDLISIPYRVNDAIGLDTIRFELCTVGDTGLFDCRLQSDTAFNRDSTAVLERFGTARFQVPFNAVSSQRFRARLVFQNRSGYRYIWQPLFQIN